jgi:hypothetical protein
MVKESYSYHNQGPRYRQLKICTATTEELDQTSFGQNSVTSITCEFYLSSDDSDTSGIFDSE